MELKKVFGGILIAGIITSANILCCNPKPQKNSNGEMVKNVLSVADDSISAGDIYNDKSLQTTRLKYRNIAYKAMFKGDNDLYEEASNWHMLNSPEEFTSFSIEMAYRHGSKKAHLDIFEYFYRATRSRLTINDTFMINFMLFNLARSKELGAKIHNVKIGSIEIAQEEIKSSNYYLDKMKR